MRIPPSVTAPPFFSAFNAAMTSGPAGAKMIAPSKTAGGGSAATWPHGTQFHCQFLVPAVPGHGVNLNSPMTHHLNRHVSRGSEAVESEVAAELTPARRNDRKPIMPAHSKGAARRSPKPSGIGYTKLSGATTYSAYPPSTV